MRSCVQVGAVRPLELPLLDDLLLAWLASTIHCSSRSTIHLLELLDDPLLEPLDEPLLEPLDDPLLELLDERAARAAR